MALMNYEKELFVDSYKEDGMLILARGLGIERIFLSFLKIFANPKNLVLVLNTYSSDEEYFAENSEEFSYPIRFVTAENLTADRHAEYLKGGVVFVTSRILVVDMLTDNIPIDFISGILVYNAHRVLESCQEALILRLFRERNKDGFIKAFTTCPESFTSGFCHVARVLKNLFIEKLFLWPRFHASVCRDLDQAKVSVIEMPVSMTSDMNKCQMCLLDLVNASTKELQRLNPSFDVDEITVENVISSQLDKILSLHLDYVWHQLSLTSRRIIAELKVMRSLLECLCQYDCIQFYIQLKSERDKHAEWLLTDSADQLIKLSYSRIWKSSQAGKGGMPEKMEECPKWKVFSCILDEIREEHEKCKLQPSESHVLIICRDVSCCAQLTKILQVGASQVLKDAWQEMKQCGTEKENSGGSCSGISGKNSWEARKPYSPENEGFTQHGSLVFIPLQGNRDPLTLVRCLYQFKPRHVIMYSFHLASVRQLEVYHASINGSCPFRVYALYYGQSVEEQQHLTKLRKEKEAFEFLIKEKASLVMTNVSEQISIQSTAVRSSRSGGLGKETQQKQIIVDLREFRSQLPSLLHKRGIKIIPRTIEIGDYILTPDICVERKSLSDLVGSLNNGRLYNQTVQMCRHYRQPVLLIEFEANKPFSLQGKFQPSAQLGTADTAFRLILLTLHFPRLSIMWCLSPYSAADLIDDLKNDRAEPDAAQAVAVGLDETELHDASKFSVTSRAVLSKMPGVTSKNIYGFMRGARDLVDLMQQPRERLVELAASEENGAKLHAFFHHKYKPGTSWGAGKDLKRPTMQRLPINAWKKKR